MPSKVTLTFADFGGEKSSFAVEVDEITGGTFVANDALIDTLVTEVGKITEGLLVKDTRLYQQTGTGTGEAAVATAQRESKWLLTYEDDITLKRYQREMPCPILTGGKLLPGIEGLADLTETDMATFVTAFEAIVNSPDGNVVSVISLRHVGRNN